MISYVKDGLISQGILNLVLSTKKKELDGIIILNFSRKIVVQEFTY